MKIIEGGITAAKGFSASGVYCGIKKRKKDMALVASDGPCTFAGSFTTNLVKAAPVVWDQGIVASEETVRAIVVNSGNANACTAEQGDEDCKMMASLTAEALGLRAEEVLVCSTGVIGVPLPMDRVKEGIASASKTLAPGPEAAADAATAICTTDTFTKEVAVSVQIGDATVHIGGMAKGSGMIHPNMATMLSFITTDAAIEKSTLQALLGSSIIDSYNMISVDGDTSTNDTVLVLANGASGSALLSETHSEWETFKNAFDYVHTALAKLVVRDGEGAGKFLEVTVQGARQETARTLARSIISSNLVKTAFFGSDANWGASSVRWGTAALRSTPLGRPLLHEREGAYPGGGGRVPLAFDERLARAILSEREVVTPPPSRTGRRAPPPGV